MSQPVNWLPNSPLVHVVAQVAFPRVPDWTEKVQALQKGFYALGFQVARQGFTTELRVTAAPPPAAPMFEQVQRPFHEFVDESGRFAFQLTDVGVVLHTTGYRTFPHLLVTLRSGLDLVSDTLGVSQVSRIGLRYVDLVQLGDGERADQYLHAGLLGFPWHDLKTIDVRQAALTNVTVGRTEIGQLIIRVNTTSPGRYLPPDLDHAGLRPPKGVDPAASGFVLDYDHFSLFTGTEATASPMAFDIEPICQHLGNLHSALRSAFEASVTEFAIKKWGDWQELSE